MEQKDRKVINGYSDKNFNYSNHDLEFLQLARDLATQYQEIYNEKRLEIKSETSEANTPQKTKK